MKRKNLPQISEAEFEVMKIVWEYAPISTNEVVERLEKTTCWSPKTIQTMLMRLEAKGALTHEKNSRVFVYSPAIPKEEYITEESSSFLHRFYDGTLKRMVLNYLEQDMLSQEEINELRSILDKKSED